MTDITLSFCIPTYNRAGFLDYLLTHLAQCKFPFAIEIIVSDNASTDTTSEVVEKHKANGAPITTYRHPTNLGSTANFVSVYHRARGKFAIYVGDDDLIIPEAIIETVQFLIANPRVLAAYAPWVLFDDVTKTSGAQFYWVDQDRIFEPEQDSELISFIVERHVFPEIAIIRAEAIRSIISEGRFSFQFFVDFARIYARGPVAFLKKPFYRSVTNSALRRNGEQGGIEQAMTSWDSYRGGLEYLIYCCLRRAGAEAAPQDEAALRSAIDIFIDMRMSVAQRLWLGKGDYIRAYEILVRRRFLHPGIAAHEAQQVGDLHQLVILQILARLANSIVGVTQVLVPNNAGPNFETMMRRCGLDQHIAVNAAPKSATPADLESSLVVLQDEAARQQFLDQGYYPGLILSQDDLSATL